jgi:BirA family biotin operon repressor/biotin-[acetyl-CoA-carboxylase] ligase
VVRDRDLRRTPLDLGVLREALRAWPFYVDVDVSESTGSTNADVAVLAREGTPEGAARATDHQLAGRGRLARSWTSPPRAGIAVSVLLRPVSVARERWTWLPLIAGVAVAGAVDRAGVSAGLKWPNDVLVDGAKIGGILLENVGGATDAVVVGIGLNVTGTASELPPGATSLALAGARDLDRVSILAGLLGGLADAYQNWCRGAGDPGVVRAAYLSRCVTTGREVRVELPGGQSVRGVARTVDLDGRLVVEAADATVALSAGDVVHVR